MKVFISLKHATEGLSSPVYVFPKETIALFVETDPVINIEGTAVFFKGLNNHKPGSLGCEDEADWYAKNGSVICLLPPKAVTTFIQE